MVIATALHVEGAAFEPQRKYIPNDASAGSLCGSHCKFFYCGNFAFLLHINSTKDRKAVSAHIKHMSSKYTIVIIGKIHCCPYCTMAVEGHLQTVERLELDFL